MEFFSVIKNMFQIEDFTIEERLNTVETSFNIAYHKLPKPEQIYSICQLVPIRDKLTIRFKNDSDNIINITNKQMTCPDFTTLVSSLDPNDTIYVSVQIDKSVFDKKFSIYDFESFTNDLIARPEIEVLGWFSTCLNGETSFKFEVFDYDVSFSTRTIAFESHKDSTFNPRIDRSQRLKACKDSSYFYNMNTYELLPDDFIIEGIMRSGDYIKSLFGKLATILSIVYVASSATINDDSINIQINGQRITSHKLLISDIQEDDKWQSIYSWIFTDGNFTDKSLIAHNVISLHCKFESFPNIDSTVFEAIKTNYKLYLRNNVDKYLNMKQDIAKFIINVVSQTGDYAIAILGKFKANLIAIFGFLFTVVLTKIGTTQKWEEIFTRHTVYIIELFILGSLVYLGICISETCYKLNKTQKGYNELKNNYKNILSNDEIQEAFNDDKLMNSTKKSVKKGIIGWSITWGILLIIAIAIIEIFTVNHGIIVWLINKFH